MSRLIRWRRTRHLAGSLAVGLVILSAGCATAVISRPFQGLKSLLPPSAAAGVAPAGPARLFVIHGMTNHDNNYADALVASVAKRLHLTLTGSEDHSEPVPVPGAAPAVTINLRTYHLADRGQEQLRVTSLTWSPVTREIKRVQFAVDNAVPRVPVNGTIKRTVINDGMSDAVLYVGTYHSVMQRAVEIALCRFMDGQVTNGECTASADFRAPVAFVSESLGSIMLFDAIEAVAQGPAGPSLQSAIDHTRVFFMFANQLPLLELAALDTVGKAGDASPTLRAEGGRLQRFLARRTVGNPAKPGLTPTTLGPLDIVAFTDPSDLLSYRLEPRDLRPDVALSNVSYPVATRWLWLVANPLKAHTGYDGDDEVLKLVVCGSAGCTK